MKKYILLFVTFCLLIAYSCKPEIDYPGYTLISKKFVKEVNANCYYFEHDKTGAKVFKISADDPNKTFSVAFRTITDTDCGTPHILEHCVLEGSKNFPVKSPFDEMSKGSLKTFLNAMTGKDMTIYPAASMNTKDYFNLMHVYFDAVFNPLVLERPTTFQQEGWHYELEDPNDPLVYKGVVYNEMKGSFSSPDREMYYQIFKHLYPDNCYRYESGGRPEAIPDLSYEQFVSYYKRHYHPSNSFIFLYGDADLGRELAFIDTAYLAAYDRAEMELDIPMHAPFFEIKEVVAPYPASPGADTKDQAMLNLSFVVGDGADGELEMAMTVLQDVLVNQESAPLRLALQDAGIGQDVSAFNYPLRQQTFIMTVKNASAGDINRFRETVFATLEKVVEEGLDKESIEGTINRMEFRLREGNTAQKGINYSLSNVGSWMYSGDPYAGLEYETPIASVKAALSSDYLEQIIQEKLIHNPHALLLLMEPEPGMEVRNSELTNEKLARYKAGLNEDEVQAIIESTRKLIAHQDSEDSPEALATIPKLSLSDVKPQTAWYEVQEKETDGLKILHFEAFTNHVVYTDFLFDMRTVNQDWIPYLRILTEVLGKMDTENFSFEEIEKEKNIHTGGFNMGMQTYLDSKNGDLLIPKFFVNVKVVNDKSDQLAELVEEVLLRTDFTDTDRLGKLLNQHLTRVESDVKGNGFGYARTRQRSYHSPDGVFSELSSGVSYYWFLKELMADFDNQAEDLVLKLATISESLFCKDNMIVGLTCGEEDYPSLAPVLTAMADRFPEQEVMLTNWNLAPGGKNEGLMAPSKVQYVLQGANFKALGYDFNGHMMVLNNLMGSEWLHPQIRVKGGAYGGFGSFNKNGEVFFGSYRDPNLSETLENFAGTSGFLKDFEASDEEMTQFIIGTVSDLDSPRTPSQMGDIAVRNYLTSFTEAEQQQIRDEVLSTNLEDIRSMEAMVEKVLSQNSYCVYGNQEKIQANKDLFESVIGIMEH